MTYSGKAIKALRRKYKISQAKLASIVGDSTPQAVSNCERGKASFPATWIKKLRNKLLITNSEAIELLDAKVGDVHDVFFKESGLKRK